MIRWNDIEPGDVICVRQNQAASVLIRLGAALRDKPNLYNHIVTFHHSDADGTMWGIEGRPGGVGWVDLKGYLASPWCISNGAQPKTDLQRKAVCDAMVQLLGTPYDWSGIAKDAMVDLHVGDLWHLSDKKRGTPGHLVCSALAAYVYDKVGLPAPVGEYRTIQPSDWAQFVITEAWHA